MSRIAIAGFQHETNSFADHRADYAYFCLHRDRPPLVRGDEVVSHLRGGSYGLSGFLDEADADWRLLPLVWASGGASGPFRYTGPVAGNVVADPGPMALLRCGGIEIAVTSRNVQAYDAAPFERLGADPRAARILVLKSSCHYRAVFEPMGESVLTVLSPGNYQPDPRKCAYRRLREGVRPLPSADA